MGKSEFGCGDWYARSVRIFRVICTDLKGMHNNQLKTYTIMCVGKMIRKSNRR